MELAEERADFGTRDEAWWREDVPRPQENTMSEPEKSTNPITRSKRGRPRHREITVAAKMLAVGKAWAEIYPSCLSDPTNKQAQVGLRKAVRWRIKRAMAGDGNRNRLHVSEGEFGHDIANRKSQVTGWPSKLKAPGDFE
jgi:hypothetical protein